MSTNQTQPITVKVNRFHAGVRLPERKTDGAACFDVYTSETADIPPAAGGERAHLIHTGLAFEIPEGYHMKVFLRSSTGLTTKLRLANQTGIIDSDYRGELNLIVENIGSDTIRVPVGSRIAQIMIEKNIDVTFQEVDILTMTERGAAPSGSTGGTIHGSV
jgi:dUTP pyrophosphatase